MENHYSGSCCHKKVVLELLIITRAIRQEAYYLVLSYNRGFNGCGYWGKKLHCRRSHNFCYHLIKRLNRLPHNLSNPVLASKDTMKVCTKVFPGSASAWDQGVQFQCTGWRAQNSQCRPNQYHHGDLTVVSMTFISIFKSSWVVNRNENDRHSTIQQAKKKACGTL